MNDIRNEIEYHVYGMRRSGHHGIIQWIMQHCGRTSVHLDDVCGKDPILHSARINTLGLPIFYAPPQDEGFQRNKNSDRLFFIYERELGGVDWQAIRNFSPKDQLILSFENHQVDHDEYHAYLSMRETFCGKSANTVKIIVVRDIHNYLASLLAAWFSKDQPIEPMMTLYKSYAEQALRALDGSSSYIFINFNRWFMSKNYRIEMAQQLGFKTSGEPYKRVPTNGGGSSFDGMAYMGKADEMPVMQRWKNYQHDARYRAILQDCALLNLSTSLFGDVTGQTKE